MSLTSLRTAPLFRRARRLCVQVLHHLIVRQHGGQAFLLNSRGQGIGLTVSAAVRAVLLMDGIEAMFPVYEHKSRELQLNGC